MNSDKVDIKENKSKSKSKKKSKFRSKSSSENELDYDNYIDNNLKLESELKDKPEILTFISRLQEIIKKQAKKIKKLKTNLKHFKKKNKTKDVVASDNDNNKKSQEPKSIIEEITEAAENAVQQTGFVYEATSGMYYDFNTGYYYNAELGLYYDGNKGTYLKYNHDTQKYVFHSQVEVVSTEPLKKEIKAKRKKQHKEQDKRAKLKKRNTNDENLEEGECSSSDFDNDDKTNGKQSETESDISDDQEIGISHSWPPCMRIIVKETTLEKIKVGSLYIVTCDGGTIGREGNVSILIPDINVSKTHAEIKFDKESNAYQINDLGSQNGTILNGKRISESKQKSPPLNIVHGSIVQIGTTKLLCHIHDGQKTCGHCEPGLIQADPVINKDEKLFNKNTQYKKELKRLKKKFGLETQEGAASDLAAGYSDRAEERRKVVGSSTDKEKTQSSSLEQSIAKENKGFKMLSKMGWSEGQALGKDGSGLKEPVPIISNPGKTGLGSSPSFSVAMGTSNASAERKSTVWKKTQQRYQLVQEVNLNAFKDSSSDEDENT